MARRVGIHLSYWQSQWVDDIIPLIGRAARAGYQGAEVPLLDPGSMDFLAVRHALDDHGLAATCGTGLSPQTDISSPDSTIRRAGLAHLRACLEGAAALGSGILGGVTYVAWGFFPNDDLISRRVHCVSGLRDAGQIAGDLGVTLCLEVLNRFESYMINTVEQGIGLLEEVGSQHVKLHLDTFHMNVEEDDIGAAIRIAGDAIGHFHCSENNRKVPGAGHIPWGIVRQALDEAAYAGWLVVESFVRPEGEVGRALNIWRPLGETLDADARAAADFLHREVSGV